MDIIEKNSFKWASKNTKQDRFITSATIVSLPSNTNKIPAEPRMSKLYSSHANRNLEDMTFRAIRF
jgi:hypothetical protein